MSLNKTQFEQHYQLHLNRWNNFVKIENDATEKRRRRSRSRSLLRDNLSDDDFEGQEDLIIRVQDRQLRKEKREKKRFLRVLMKKLLNQKISFIIKKWHYWTQVISKCYSISIQQKIR